MSGLSFEIVHEAMAYWQGALSEPALMISGEEAALAVANGAVIWDVRSSDEYRRGHAEGALSLGGVDWLLADTSGGNLIPANVIADALEQAGIQPGRPVVVYAERQAVDAFVALRALRSIGIADARVCLGEAGNVAGLQPRAKSARAGNRLGNAAHQQVNLSQVL